jgi:hypothetical protein
MRSTFAATPQGGATPPATVTAATAASDGTRSVPLPSPTMDWFFLFRRKARYKLSEFPHYDIRIELFKVRTGKRAYRFEVDLLERRKAGHEKTGTVRLEHAAQLCKLLADVQRHANGLT